MLAVVTAVFFIQLYIGGLPIILVGIGALGLGGADKPNAEPQRFAFDLWVGDVKAIAGGDLRKANMLERRSA